MLRVQNMLPRGARQAPATTPPQPEQPSRADAAARRDAGQPKQQTGSAGATAKMAPGTWCELGNPDFADTIRRICTQCGWTQAAAGAGRTLAVASAREGEGRSSIARAIAVSMAEDHASQVLLIECDLVHPSLAKDFDLDGSGTGGQGLVEVLTGTAWAEEVVRRTGLPNLWLLPAGGPHDNPSRVLRSAAFTAFLDEVRKHFAFVVLDLPAVEQSSDAAVLAQLTDGTIFVVRAGATDQRAVERSLQLLGNARLHGVVLNRRRSAVPGFVRRIAQL